METLGAFLERAVERFGPRPALLTKRRYRGQVWSYDRLWQETARVARWLQVQGIGKGDRVILWAPNSPWWVATFFASARLGAIVVPLDVRSNPDFVAHGWGRRHRAPT